MSLKNENIDLSYYLFSQYIKQFLNKVRDLIVTNNK